MLDKFKKRKTEDGVIDYQCPFCNRWFRVYGYCNWGIKLHISRTAKQEAVAQKLGEIKKTPHFDYWVKNTDSVKWLYRKREWK